MGGVADAASKGNDTAGGTGPQRPGASPGFKLPWWVPGDWNAFFGLGTNSLLNILVLTGLLLGVVQIPAEVVFGRILPAVGVMLVISNVYYAFMGRRLAKKTGRTDVAAMPAGPSVPHMFIVVLIVMLPVRIATGDPIKAWQAGLAWAFIEGVVNLSGVLIAPTVRKWTPRGALLGTLAGVSIAFIAMTPAMRVFLQPVIGLVCLGIVFGGWFAGIRFPWGVPAGLAAIGVGTIIGWATGLMDFAAVTASLSEFGLHVPTLSVTNVFAGFSSLAPLLVTAIPFGIYDFIEATDNVESAAAAGDEYNVQEVLAVDGVGSILGTMLGSPIANAVYIGQPGWKSVGGRTGYSLATAVLVSTVTFLGIVPLLLALIPLAAIYPILLYIGALIGAQAFQVTPRAHAPAIIIAMVPHFAAWASGLVDGALAAAGVTAAAIGAEVLENNGVIFEGLHKLGGGAIISGMILGAITIFLIDHRFKAAAAYSAIGAVLAFFGFIHSEKIGVAVSIPIAAGYLLLAALCFGYAYMRKANEGDEAALMVPG
jgi:AGZA family xanthine/uracil permease-like MFS transporter